MENTITVVEEHLDGFPGDACLVRDQDGNHFVVSTITREQWAHAYGSIETMAFRSDRYGTVLDWLEVAGGGEMTRSDVFETLASGEVHILNESDCDDMTFDSEWYPDDDWEDWYRDDSSLSEYDNSSPANWLV